MTAPFTPMEAWTQYKYVLELDGGSSTWRFKNALLGGFVVFKVDSDDQQFFFSALEPFVHYVPVDKQDFEADLLAKLAWAEAHPEDCARIAKSARKFAHEHLMSKGAAWQQAAALHVRPATANR